MKTHPEVASSDRLATTIRRSRRIALGLGLLPLLGGVLGALGFAHRGSSPSTGWLLLVLSAPYLLGVPFGAVYAALFWRMSRRPPAGFQLGESAGRPAFVVPLSPLSPGVGVIQMATVAGLNLEFAVNAWEARVPLAGFMGATTALLAICAGQFLFFVRPRLKLTSDGLVIRPFRTDRRVPWDALLRGGPAPPDRRWAPIRLLMVEGTAGLVTWKHANGRLAPPGYGWYHLRINRSLVNGAFLARMIYHYRENPGARVAIGTPEALDALLGANQAGAELPRAVPK